jgi:hypothetical protein
MGEKSILIPLTKGFHALIDALDAPKVLQYKWCASIESNGTKVYAIRRETRGNKRVKIRMHRFILGLDVGPAGPVVDHINGDSLDNRRSNLEVVSQQENNRRGHAWVKFKKKVEEPAL